VYDTDVYTHVTTLLEHVQAELTQKRKNNIRTIVQGDYAALCGPKPGNQAAKRKPKNVDTEFLLEDNLKADAKMAKNGMFRSNSHTNRRRVKITSSEKKEGTLQ